MHPQYAKHVCHFVKAKNADKSYFKDLSTQLI